MYLKQRIECIQNIYKYIYININALVSSQSSQSELFRTSSVHLNHGTVTGTIKLISDQAKLNFCWYVYTWYIFQRSEKEEKIT